MDRNKQRVLRLRNYVLSRNSSNNGVAEEPTKEVKEDVNVIDYEGMTKAEIGELLTEKGIEYNPRDNKTKLIDLLLGSD